MRQKMLGLLLCLALVATPALANSKLFVWSGTVTTVNQTLTFVDNHSGGDNQAFDAQEIVIRSSVASTDTCYFDPLDDTATAADVPLEPGASINWPLGRFYNSTAGYAEMGVICASGTAEWTVTALR
jgi:hypothetical protein